MTEPRAGVHYLEDLEPGQVFRTKARTVTEADVVAFASFSGDWNPIHTDAEYAAATPYGQRVVYGLAAIAIATGLLDRLGTFSGSAIAMLGIDHWTFEGPIFIGDTLHVLVHIEDVRVSASNPDRGIVQRRFELINQSGKRVQAGQIDVMVQRRPAAGRGQE